MTERSRPWDGTGVGDAVEAPYDAATEFARILRSAVFGAEQTANKGGVVNGASGFGDYAASVPGANTVRIASGVGHVQGNWHESDTNVDFTIATPAAQTRVDRIVLRKSWSGQTIRLTRIAGVEGSGLPAMTQVFGTTWDVPIVQASITTGGAITLTDDRPLLLVHTHIASGSGGAISHANLASVGINDHHTRDHAAAHESAGGDVIPHQTLSGSGSFTHSQLDGHLTATAAPASGPPHGITRVNTTGTVALGTPSDGRITFARAKGGPLTMTSVSTNINVGTQAAVASFTFQAGFAYTFIADGTNWDVY